MSPASEFTIEVGRDVTAVSALREVWEKLQSDPNADIDFYLTILRSRSEILRPHVIVLRRNGVVQSILVGRIEKKPFEIWLGYKKISLPPVRFLTLVHGGLLGDNSEACVAKLVDSVQNSLRDGEADVAWFHGLETDSAYCQMARKVGGVFTRDRFPIWIQHWSLQLPASFEELVRRRSSRSRYNLKRYSKLLREAFGDQLTVRAFRGVNELESMLTDLETIASKTYHRGLGAGFINNDENRKLITLAANQDWLRAHILYIKGSPAAYWTGILYKRTLFTWTTGYDPDFREFRLGTFLLQRMLDDLCRESGAEQVDFGFGDAEYKREWGDHERQQASFFLFSPGLTGLFLNMLRTPAMGASALVRGVLARTGALQKVKKIWRGRLTSEPRRSSSEA
jgi:hypothetical protein